MITENLSTLKINKLSQAQYNRELENGTLDASALYLTPDEEIDLSPYATIEYVDSKAGADHNHDDVYYTEIEVDTLLAEKANASHNHDSSYDAKGSAATAVDEHNESASAHGDIRGLVNSLQTEVNDNLTTLTNHKNDKSNPHEVTLSQLGVTATASELNYVDGVTSNIQTQLDEKADASNVLLKYETIQIELDDKASASHTHKINDVNGLQNQLDGKAASSHNHSASDITSGTLSSDILPLNDIVNLHVWRKYTGEPNKYIETEYSNAVIHASFFTISSPYYNKTVSCSSEITISDDKVSLKNPKNVTADGENVCGKYVSVSNDVYYIPEDAVVTTVEQSDGKTITCASVAIKIALSVFSGYVASKVSDTYPASGEHTDGYWYQFVGQIGDAISANVATVSEVETYLGI